MIKLRLQIEFGFQGIKRDVVWNKELLDFPKIITYGGKTWEWVIYDADASGVYDYKMMFSEMKAHKVSSLYGVALPVPDFDKMFGAEMIGSTGKCDCGAVYTSFPSFHMSFCPKWVKQ